MLNATVYVCRSLFLFCPVLLLYFASFTFYGSLRFFLSLVGPSVPYIDFLHEANSVPAGDLKIKM